MRSPWLLGCVLAALVACRPEPPPRVASEGAGVAMTDRLAAVREALTQRWPKNRSVHFVFHGHSVPAGYFATPVVNTYSAYPHLVGLAVKERYPFAVVNVIVTAIGGEASPKGAARFASDVLVHRPDVVAIDYALNDRKVPEAQVEAAWRSMIAQARDAGAVVVLVTPTGDNTASIGDPTDLLEQRAALIRRLATEEGVLLADVWAAWRAELDRGTPIDDLLSQPNHPNERGHQLTSAVIATVLLDAP